MSQRQQLERVMEIDRQIHSGLHLNAGTLAHGTEVSKRVIFNNRDFMINRLGAPIGFDRKKGGWFYADETWVPPNIMVSEGGAPGVFPERGGSAPLFRDSAGSLASFSGRENRLGNSWTVSVDLEILRAHYTFAAPSLSSVREQALFDIHRAISNNRKIWMRNYTASRDEHADRIIEPYHLYNLHGDWYLIVMDDKCGGFRNFLVSRMDDRKVMPDKFILNPHFSVQDYMGRAF